MKDYIDLATWKRREHYDFFSQFDDPVFGITTHIDCTHIYKHCHATGESFFLRSLHWLMRAANATEAFRLRIEDGRVVRYDVINVSPTIGREDGTFGFGFFTYHDDFDTFAREAQVEIERVKGTPGLAIKPELELSDVLYYSALPWYDITEMKHATSFNSRGDSVPRLTTGKVMHEGDRYSMALSVAVHHALADGHDIGFLIDNLAKMEAEEGA